MKERFFVYHSVRTSPVAKNNQFDVAQVEVEHSSAQILSTQLVQSWLKGQKIIFR